MNKHLFKAVSQYCLSLFGGLLACTIQANPLIEPKLSNAESDIALVNQDAETTASAMQQGLNNPLLAGQITATGSQVITIQIGHDNRAEILQQGLNNRVHLTQLGQANFAEINQVGDNNQANILQQGLQTFRITQYGNEMNLTLSSIIH